MTNIQQRDLASFFHRYAGQSSVQPKMRGLPFFVDTEKLAEKSAKVAALLKQDTRNELSEILQEIPADPETFELVARFCLGFQVQMSAANVLPLACLAHYLEMDEGRCRNNLLSKALAYFEHRVLPYWDLTVKALCSTHNIHPQAKKLGLIDACIESIVEKTLIDTQFLTGPRNNEIIADDGDEDNVDNGNNAVNKPNVRRKLFTVDLQLEDLTTLPISLYEPTIHAMNQHGVPAEYVTACICSYAKMWVFLPFTKDVKTMLICKNSPREVIEALERILPNKRGLLPCLQLFEMLHFAVVLEASAVCIHSFEVRIGKQLDLAAANDFLVAYRRSVGGDQFDIEFLRRILKSFYGNYTSSDALGLIAVAETVEEFLGEAVTDMNMRTDAFISLAEMSIAASYGLARYSDGIYRAIDVYLDNHRHLTELEKEEICKVLDCHKMSHEACEHAAKNERLPLRVVVQVLFIGQLQLRDMMIGKEIQGVDEKSREEEAVKEDVLTIKVMELERLCHMMKKQIEQCCSNRVVKKEKVSMWRGMKRKFGCISSMKDCKCQMKKKKVHLKHGL